MRLHARKLARLGATRCISDVLPSTISGVSEPEHVDAHVTREQLLAVIETQTRIARLALDVEGVMSVVAERAQALTGASGAAVEMVEGQQMVVRAATGSAGGMQGERLDERRGVSGRCVEARELLRCDDSERDPRVDRDAARRIGARSILVAPLIHDGRAVGVLKVVAPGTSAFHDGHAELLRLLSHVIAASIYSAIQVSADDLFQRATHDPLTGAANRSLLFDRLKRAIAEAKREDGRFSVVIADLDAFSHVNDVHGRTAGDAVLRAVADRMRRCVRQVDTVARLRGDAFAVLLRTHGDADGARLVVQRMREEVARPVDLDGDQLAIGMSFGVATYPEDGVEPAALVQRADERTQQDGRSGRTPSEPS